MGRRRESGPALAADRREQRGAALPRSVGAPRPLRAPAGLARHRADGDGAHGASPAAVEPAGRPRHGRQHFTAHGVGARRSGRPDRRSGRRKPILRRGDRQSPARGQGHSPGRRPLGAGIDARRAAHSNHPDRRSAGAPRPPDAGGERHPAAGCRRRPGLLGQSDSRDLSARPVVVRGDAAPAGGTRVYRAAARVVVSGGAGIRLQTCPVA